MEERRSVPRHRVLKGAHITFNNGAVISCTVRDISERGARLKVASVIGIPEHFTLVTDDNGRHPCTVIHRHEKEIGVRFDA
ncbi:MAG: PilZ domain-containing protein [Flavobacteriaceae bacterium]